MRAAHTIIIATLIASLAGCATEADRTCPMLRATGVAASGVIGAGCNTGTAACPAGTECLNEVCSVRCTRGSDCRLLGPRDRGVCLRGSVCVQACASDDDCPAGTTCYESPVTSWTVCFDDSPCHPRRFCARVHCD